MTRLGQCVRCTTPQAVGTALGRSYAILKLLLIDDRIDTHVSGVWSEGDEPRLQNRVCAHQRGADGVGSRTTDALVHWSR